MNIYRNTHELYYSATKISHSPSFVEEVWVSFSYNRKYSLHFRQKSEIGLMLCRLASLFVCETLNDKTSVILPSCAHIYILYYIIKFFTTPLPVLMLMLKSFVHFIVASYIKFYKIQMKFQLKWNPYNQIILLSIRHWINPKLNS